MCRAMDSGGLLLAPKGDCQILAESENSLITAIVSMSLALALASFKAARHAAAAISMGELKGGLLSLLRRSTCCPAPTMIGVLSGM